MAKKDRSSTKVSEPVRRKPDYLFGIAVFLAALTSWGYFYAYFPFTLSTATELDLSGVIEPSCGGELDAWLGDIRDPGYWVICLYGNNTARVLSTRRDLEVYTLATFTGSKCH